MIQRNFFLNHFVVLVDATSATWATESKSELQFVIGKQGSY